MSQETPEKQLVVHSEDGSADETPQLVSKGRYLWVMTGRTAAGSAALFLSLLGGIVLLFAAIGSLSSMVDSASNGLIAAVLLAAAFCLARTKNRIKPVMPITRHTVDLLPPKESLLRAANSPPSQPQTELLRAAKYGEATPSEELLRATTTAGEEP